MRRYSFSLVSVLYFMYSFFSFWLYFHREPWHLHHENITQNFGCVGVCLSYNKFITKNISKSISLISIIIVLGWRYRIITFYDTYSDQWYWMVERNVPKNIKIENNERSDENWLWKMDKNWGTVWIHVVLFIIMYENIAQIVINVMDIKYHELVRLFGLRSLVVDHFFHLNVRKLS